VRSPFASRKWHTVATADLTEYPPWQNTPRLRWEAATWREYQLALIMPMRFPEFTDDRDISATIRHVATHEKLPWEFHDDEWSAICKQTP
jgi:hypothetical protein